MRYFVEVSYRGTNYAGFQVQLNSKTIQQEVEAALSTVYRTNIKLTGSSRTDAGVHAFQNYFHFDIDKELQSSLVYNANALLPLDIVIKSLYLVAPELHARFSAISRQYKYFISKQKDPFAVDTAWYYPFTVDLHILNMAAKLLFNYSDFTSFSKRNTQTYTNDCTILKSEWTTQNNMLIYTVQANRFLRGMVRGLVGTMLLVGRKKTMLSEFEEIIQGKDCTRANFATPPHALFLEKIDFPALTKLS